MAAVRRTDLWRAVRDEVESLGQLARRDEDHALRPGAIGHLAEAIAADDEDPAIAYATGREETRRAVERWIDAGVAAIAVVPVAVAVDAPTSDLEDPDLARLHQDLDALARRHPGIEIQYVGPPFHDAPALEAAIAALRPAGSEEPALLAIAVERAFDGDIGRFGRFMQALQRGVPEGTVVALRGSAVQGASFQTGEPFDARGSGTSDLDLVLLGEEAMARWHPDGFYLPGVNTLPLDDSSPTIADVILERARREAQAIAGRPIALQAMARWFLDLRSALQGTPYVILGG